ncbi:hypothetical protein [Nostoc sp.]
MPFTYDCICDRSNLLVKKERSLLDRIGLTLVLAELLDNTSMWEY